MRTISHATRHATLPGDLVLRSVFPCCGGRCRFRAAGHVRLERYARRCPSCGGRWRIERTLLSDTGAVRSDRLEWTRDAVAYRLDVEGVA